MENRNEELKTEKNNIKEDLDKYKNFINNIKPSLKYELCYGEWKVKEYWGNVGGSGYERDEEEIRNNLEQTLRITHDKVEYRGNIYSNPLYEYFVLPNDPYDRIYYRGKNNKDLGIKGDYYTLFYFYYDCKGEIFKNNLIDGFYVIDNDTMILLIKYGEYYLLERTASYRNEYMETFEILN